MKAIFYEYTVPGTRYRVDFAAPSLMRGCELDGYTYHEGMRSPGRVKATEDKQRERALDRAGWKLTRFSGDEIRADAGACAREWLLICGISPLSVPRRPVCEDCEQPDCSGDCAERAEEAIYLRWVFIAGLAQCFDSKARRTGLLPDTRHVDGRVSAAQHEWAREFLDAGYQKGSCHSDGLYLAYLNEADDGGGMQFGPFIACQDCPLLIPASNDYPDWLTEHLVREMLSGPGHWTTGGNEIRDRERSWWLDPA